MKSINEHKMNIKPALNEQEQPSFDGQNPPASDDESETTDNAEEITITEGDEPPTFDGQKPFGGRKLPMFDGKETPIFDGEEPAASDDESETADSAEKITVTESDEPPTFDGQKSFDGRKPAMFGAPQDMRLWGNDKFDGEDVLRGDNFTTSNDLEEIADTNGADIAINFGQENFGNFDMMAPSFNDQGGQFNQQPRHGMNERK